MAEPEPPNPPSTPPPSAPASVCDPCPPPRAMVRLRVPARAESLHLVRSTVRDAATKAGARDAWVRDLVLAVDEVCQNIIRHAYHGSSLPGCDIVVELDVVCDHSGHALEVRLTDFAPPVDPGKIVLLPLPDPTDPIGGLRLGGLGLHLVKALTDASGVVPPPPGAGNTFRLLKRL